MQKKRVVIIVPTYNEKENIQRVIPALERVFKEISNADMHILVVDDSSPDGTGEIVQQLSKQYAFVHLFTNAKKAGLGAAYLKGMAEAFGPLKADIVFEFDADLSHDPTKIPQMLQKIDEGYDMVLGSRYMKGGSIPSNWGFHRKLLSVFGNLFINLVLTTFAIRDWTGGFRAITKRVYDKVHGEMNQDKFSGYTFQIGFLHKAVRKGFKIAEVPFHFVDRTYGHSKLGAEYFKKALLYILEARFREILAMRVFKFAVVGFMGFVVNTIGLLIFSKISVVQSLSDWLYSIFPLAFINVSGIASALGAECAIVSNFTWNNLWTFHDRKLTSPWQIVPKFLQFNLSSFAAVAIQFLVVGFGTSLTGQTTISRFSWLIVATAIGMVVNYLIYSKIIWKEKKSK